MSFPVRISASVGRISPAAIQIAHRVRRFAFAKTAAAGAIHTSKGCWFDPWYERMQQTDNKQ